MSDRAQQLGDDLGTQWYVAEPNGNQDWSQVPVHSAMTFLTHRHQGAFVTTQRPCKMEKLRL